MKKNILTCICHAVLLFALCLPAEARMIIGLTPAPPFSTIDQAAFNQLRKELTATASTDVKIRRFDSEATVLNWLLRFQEIDAAIVPPGVISKQPAGTLHHLVDLHIRSNSSSPLLLVVRSNLDSKQAARIKEAFLKLDTKDGGRITLEKLGLTGVTLPGKALKRDVAKPAPPPAQTKPAKASLPAIKEKLAAEEPLLKAEPAPKPATDHPIRPEPPKGPSPVEKNLDANTAVEANNEVSEKPAIAEGTPEAGKVREALRAELKPADQLKPAEINEQQGPGPDTIKPEKPEKPETPAESQQPKPAPNKRLTLFVALLLLLAILLKLTLFAMRWKSKKIANSPPEETPAVNTDLSSKDEAPALAAHADGSVEEDLVIEAGSLGSGKVPALLKRCADLPKPVVLKITKGTCEKLIYFAGGQVSGALTQNIAASASGMRWNKLGNLLVREELVTNQACEQATALLIEEPGLRFGEALLKLGLIDLAGLRHALTRQAKVTIYSLILFPEGRYQILAGDGALPPEESISLEITALIREASHHQSEWTAIRQALPNLNTKLDFTPEGRAKLEKVSISMQQEATLARIDGTQTINDLCLESSMMDYEVYRFLYLMVKAGVLE